MVLCNSGVVEDVNGLSCDVGSFDFDFDFIALSCRRSGSAVCFPGRNISCSDIQGYLRAPDPGCVIENTLLL
jgi:hypothetical protein